MASTRLCRLAALLLGLAFAPAACGPAAAHGAGLRTHRFAHDGLTREYLLYRPPGHAALAGRRPLVMVLHGGGGTGRGMVRLTRGRWNRLADRDGFFVVYPNADARIWDFGEGVVSRRRARRVDDLAYLRRVLGEVTAMVPVDPARVFATGMSRGGQASYFLACRMPGVFRAIAPVAMALPDFLADDCRAGPPTGLVVINGTDDPLVPYGGGTIRVFGRPRGEVLSTDRTIALWRRRNGCAGAPTATVEIDRPGDATSVTRTDWTTCSGAPVTLYRVANGGHTWPSGRAYLGRRLIGEVSHDIDAAEEIWRFFQRF